MSETVRGLSIPDGPRPSKSRDVFGRWLMRACAVAGMLRRLKPEQYPHRVELPDRTLIDWRHWIKAQREALVTGKLKPERLEVLRDLFPDFPRLRASHAGLNRWQATFRAKAAAVAAHLRTGAPLEPGVQLPVQLPGKGPGAAGEVFNGYDWLKQKRRSATPEQQAHLDAVLPAGWRSLPATNLVRAVHEAAAQDAAGGAVAATPPGGGGGAYGAVDDLAMALLGVESEDIVDVEDANTLLWLKQLCEFQRQHGRLPGRTDTLHGLAVGNWLYARRMRLHRCGIGHASSQVRPWLFAALEQHAPAWDAAWRADVARCADVARALGRLPDVKTIEVEARVWETDGELEELSETDAAQGGPMGDAEGGVAGDRRRLWPTRPPKQTVLVPASQRERDAAVWLRQQTNDLRAGKLSAHRIAALDAALTTAWRQHHVQRLDSASSLHDLYSLHNILSGARLPPSLLNAVLSQYAPRAAPTKRRHARYPPLAPPDSHDAIATWHAALRKVAVAEPRVWPVLRYTRPPPIITTYQAFWNDWQFMVRVLELEEHVRSHGHLPRHDEDHALHAWLSRVRSKQRTGMLDPAREQLLDIVMQRLADHEGLYVQWRTTLRAKAFLDNIAAAQQWFAVHKRYPRSGEAGSVGRWLWKCRRESRFLSASDLHNLNNLLPGWEDVASY